MMQRATPNKKIKILIFNTFIVSLQNNSFHP